MFRIITSLTLCRFVSAKLVADLALWLLWLQLCGFRYLASLSWPAEAPGRAGTSTIEPLLIAWHRYDNARHGKNFRLP